VDVFGFLLISVLYHTQTLTSSIYRTDDLAAHFMILPTLKHYASSTRNELRSRGWKIHDGYSIYLEKVDWIKRGSADGVWRGRKRRLDEEFRMEVDGDDIGVVQRDVGDVGGFRGVSWNVERLEPSKRDGEGARIGVVAQ
jgi:hypothetical protein